LIKSIKGVTKGSVRGIKRKPSTLSKKMRVSKLSLVLNLDTGKILSSKDGIARVNGLFGVRSGEMVLLGISKMQGMVLSLEYSTVSIVVFGNDTFLRQGDHVYRTFVIMNIPLSVKLFGRVIDALGNTIDGGQKLETKLTRKVDTKATGIIPRQSVCESMHTGINAIDSITPIGCGQRELIIGDRKTGKTTIALDTILSQREYGSLYCIYVAVGQKRSTVAQIVQFLKRKDALSTTIIVAANSSEPATLQFLAPYSGCSIGE
jgi:proton translocating ATP synthase F1 alpha subunit